ncbi:MAG TPA: IS21 family transposase [Pedobacter sp.]
MSNKLITMQVVRSIIQQLHKGYSHRRIARELQLSRNTVKRYASQLASGAHSLEALQQMDDANLSAIVHGKAKQLQPETRKIDFTSRIDYFLSELKRTGVTRLLLWQEYKKQYPEGYEYAKFCELLGNQKQIEGATMHFQHKPADVMMVDFAGDSLSYVLKETGEVISCPVLVCVLPYSGYSYVSALVNASLVHVVKALNECLNYFQGVPHSFKSDNMKQIVTKSCRYEPTFTDMMQQWALHNNIALLAARVRKPKDKASVENEVKLTYQRIYAPLRDKVFFSLEELNRSIKEQLAAHHQLPFQKKAYNRYECFIKEEKPLLQSLPLNIYVIKHYAEAKVQKNYHITLGEDWNHYSVPFIYIGKKVNAIYDSDIVEIYYQHQRIALHKRSYKKHSYSTVKEHMPEGHQRYFEQRGWNAEYFLRQAEKMGPFTHQYIKGMLQGKHFTEQTYNGCLGVLRLAKVYTDARLEAACKRALKGNSYAYKIVSNILSNNLDKLQTEQPTLFDMPEHENLRGPQAYN